MPPPDHKLANPAWYSLQETHSHFAIGDDTVKRYQPHVVAFAAFDQVNPDALKKLDTVFNLGDSLFLIGDLPALPANYAIESLLSCVQMTCTSEIKITATETIEKLHAADDEQMLALINTVLPGYYKRGTRLMGDYYGIRHQGRLVAMTGERMCMNGLTEISAVATHPDFAGRGYAQQLVAHVANKNRSSGIIPFLHTGTANERAIKVYEHLGFTTRRIINFTKVKRME